MPCVGDSIKKSGIWRYNTGMGILFSTLMQLCLAACTEVGAGATTVTAPISPPPSPVETPAPASLRAEPNVDDGKSIWVLNPNFATYWSHENAYLNRARYFGEPSEDKWAGYKLGIVRGDGDENAASHYHGQWVLSWKGTAKLTLGGTHGRLQSDGRNRIVETFTGDRPLAWVESRSLDYSDVAFYRLEDEAAFQAGENFSPDFVDLVSRYKILRPLDWNRVNGSLITSSDEMMPAEASSWENGPPVEAQFDLAAKAGVSLWLNVPAMIGLPNDLREAAVAASALPAADGKPQWKVRQEAQLAVFEQAFDRTLASTEWDRLARRLVSALEASNYPENRQFYLELGNETWGTHFLNGIYFWGMKGGFTTKTGVYPPGQPMQGPYGYFSARLACAFGKALKEAGREGQAWTVVINSQTVWPDQTKGALEGAKTYRCGADTQPMSRYGVSVTGYWDGGFKWNKNNLLFGVRLGYDAWIKRWQDEFRADKNALAQRIENYLTADMPAPMNNSYVVQRALQHQAIAESYGARFIGQYEGGSHDNIDGTLKKTAGVMDFARAFMAGEHTAAIIRDQAQRMKEALPGAINANYHHWGPSYDPSKPWDTAPVWDASSPAARAMSQQLRAPQ